MKNQVADMLPGSQSVTQDQGNFGSLNSSRSHADQKMRVDPALDGFYVIESIVTSYHSRETMQDLNVPSEHLPSLDSLMEIEEIYD